MGIDYGDDMHPIDGYTLIDESIYTAMYGTDEGLGPSLSCGALSPAEEIEPPEQPITPGSPYYQNNCVAR